MGMHPTVNVIESIEGNCGRFKRINFSKASGKTLNQDKSSFSSKIRHWASRQLVDYDAGQPGMMFAEGVVLNVSQGYELQTAVTQLRCDRGERAIGYKVGCTSPKIRAQLGIDHCVSGRLFDSERHPSGETVSRERFTNLAIEGELAVELCRQPNEDDFVGVAIPTCIARVFPVIELHNQVMRGGRPSAGELIGNNAIHAGFVLGDGVRPAELCDERSFEALTLSIFADDRLIDECAGSVLIQTIKSSLKWLTKVVRDRGERLDAGQIVLTGSIPALIPIVEDCRVQVDTQPFGSVEINFTN